MPSTDKIYTPSIGDIVRPNGECSLLYLQTGRFCGTKSMSISLRSFCLISTGKTTGKALFIGNTYMPRFYSGMDTSLNIKDINKWTASSIRESTSHWQRKTRKKADIVSMKDFLNNITTGFSKYRPMMFDKFLLIGKTTLNKSRASVLLNKYFTLVVKDTSLEKISRCCSLLSGTIKQVVSKEKEICIRVLMDLLGKGKLIPQAIVQHLSDNTLKSPAALAALSSMRSVKGKDILDYIPYCCEAVVADYEEIDYDFYYPHPPKRIQRTCPYCTKRLARFGSPIHIRLDRSRPKNIQTKIGRTVQDTSVNLLGFIDHLQHTL